MRIQCPSCTAIYDVADALLDPPRTVRCAQCSNDWMATAMPEAIDEPTTPPASADDTATTVATHQAEAAHAEGAAGDPASVGDSALVPGDTPLSAIERLSAPVGKASLRSPRSRMLLSAWAASIAVLALLSVAGYAKRETLMAQWPASKRVYATFGLPQAEDRTAATIPAH